MGGGRSQTPCTLPRFHTPPPSPSHSPPSNPSTGLIKALALRDRPLPACPFDLLAPSAAVEPTQIVEPLHHPWKTAGWSAKQLPSLLQPRPNPTTPPGPSPDQTPDQVPFPLAAFFDSRLPTTIRHHPTTPPRTLPSGLPSLSGHSRKAGKELGPRIVATRGVCPVSNTATFNNLLRPFFLVHLPTTLPFASTSRIPLCLVAKFHFFVRQTCCARIFFPSLYATTDDVNTRLAGELYWLLAEKTKH